MSIMVILQIIVLLGAIFIGVRSAASVSVMRAAQACWFSVFVWA